MSERVFRVVFTRSVVRAQTAVGFLTAPDRETARRDAGAVLAAGELDWHDDRPEQAVGEAVRAVILIDQEPVTAEEAER